VRREKDERSALQKKLHQMVDQSTRT